jgi:hypothetical protein
MMSGRLAADILLTLAGIALVAVAVMEARASARALWVPDLGRERKAIACGVLGLVCLVLGSLVELI